MKIEALLPHRPHGRHHLLIRTPSGHVINGKWRADSRSRNKMFEGGYIGTLSQIMQRAGTCALCRIISRTVQSFSPPNDKAIMSDAAG